MDNQLTGSMFYYQLINMLENWSEKNCKGLEFYSNLKVEKQGTNREQIIEKFKTNVRICIR